MPPADVLSDYSLYIMKTENASEQRKFFKKRKFQFIVQLSRHTVGREQAPAAEKWNIFRIFRRKIIELCLRHGILLYKMPGGSKPPPYDKTVL